MTQDEIQNIYAHQSEEYGHKLNSFYQLRSIFTPLIEGLILLDRLTYMHQQVNIILKMLRYPLVVTFLLVSLRAASQKHVVHLDFASSNKSNDSKAAQLMRAAQDNYGDPDITINRG